jgi:hypothetical protein
MKINRVNTNEQGVKRLSLVGLPANGEDVGICSLSDGCKIDAENRIVDSLVLKAKQKIYRKKPEMFIYFNQPTIEDLAQKFIANDVELSIDHSLESTDGLEVADSYMDGDEWRVKLKVQDDSIWDRVQDGSLRGISIESKLPEETILEITDDIEKFKVESNALEPDIKQEVFGQFIN